MTLNGRSRRAGRGRPGDRADQAPAIRAKQFSCGMPEVIMFTRCFALAVFLLLTAAAQAQPVVIMVDTSAPPFMFETSARKAAGVYPALVREAFIRVGVEVSIEPLPWKRALAEAKAGRGGLAGAYKTPDRAERLDFSEPIFVETLLAVTLRGGEFPLTGVSALKGRRVGIIRGWSYGNGFDKARVDGLFTAVESDSDAQSLEKLLARQIDVMIAIREGADACIALSPRPGAFTVLMPPLSEVASYVALPKSPENRELLARFNAALASMRQDGTWDKIVMGILARP